VQEPFLSIIIPAYNEESRLPATLDQVGNFLHAQSYTAEVLIVNNNSSDRTGEIIQEYAGRFPSMSGCFEAQPGKGAAVRQGMRQAQGDFQFMCDADLSMPIKEINRFLPPLLEDFDLAIASREAPGSVRYHEPQFRHLGGRLMNWLIQLTILPGLNDTQCGFKCFTREAARDLFHQQRLTGWSFDIELLYIARQRGYTVREIAIPWYYHEESKVHAVRDALKILRDIQTIRRNYARDLYAPEN
jgi:glycosyltransferase involved in cell wall biosynthesis